MEITLCKAKSTDNDFMVYGYPVKYPNGTMSLFSETKYESFSVIPETLVYLTKWIDAEIERPTTGQEIIFINAIGMCKGTFHTIGDGVVYVDNKQTDIINFDSIYQWIPYPKED